MQNIQINKIDQNNQINKKHKIYQNNQINQNKMIIYSITVLAIL